MKSFLCLVLCLCSVETMAGEKVPVSGKACYTYGDNESPIMGEEAALNLAKQKAVESYKVFVQSRSLVEDMITTKHLVSTLAVGSLYNLEIKKVSEEEREVCVEITAAVDPEEIEKAMEEARLKKKKKAVKASKKEINW
ncbi:MAG: hypothetical protein KAJ75_01855 [Alphaproteobacteria bacterium]|nr:hypothetical protein [Alphaproteobacteria bacterium]